MRFARLLLCWSTLTAAMTVCVNAQSDDLLRGFEHPPDSAKPRTWWHWTNGNVTEDGIAKDLEWMKRVGIGGFQLVDVAAGGGQTVETKINFGTPEWLHAVRHAAEEGKRLNLEMSIFSSPGWSEAGGPWVTPEMAMKRLVWSETEIEGGREFVGMLAQPPANEGPVRDLMVGKQPAEHFYRDAAVVAFRVPAAAEAFAPKVTSSAGDIDAAALLDDSLNSSVKIASPKDGSPAWVQFSFEMPFTARALSIGHHGGIPVGKLLASDDGANWRTIVVMPGPQGYHGAPIRTYGFDAVTARYFRVQLEGAPVRPGQIIHGGPVVPAAQFELTELKLFSDARVNRWEDKGTFGSLMNVYEVAPTPNAPKDVLISDVVDLTGKMDADGMLHWTAPVGEWRVLRMGYADTGARNRPSVPAGSGLEVDKLSPKYVSEYVKGYLDPIQGALGSLFGDHPSYVTMDSWEAGMQNWTDTMVADFKSRRGYDPTPYLPVLAGHVVQSAEVSDRFLWDFRRTLADMFADNFYGTMEAELNKRGLKTYAEASGVALEIPEDTLKNKEHIDIPMAEFWVHALHPESEYYVDVRGAASAGHVFGKPIIATESFTGGGYESPYTLKKVADYWFAQGVNRLVFHTSAHQPLDTKPGNTMVGTHINRNITWADQGGSFMTYVSRMSYMLQQGRFVADIAYLLPEGAPATMPFWGKGLRPALPKGYDYDFVNTDVLLDRMTVGTDGRIVLPSGMSYRVLVLPPTDEMSVRVIRKVEELVRAGAWVVGERPRHSAGLAGYPQSDAEVRRTTEELWGGLDGVTNTQRAVGKGMVIWGLELGEVLEKAGVAPDMQMSAALDGGVVGLHRTLADAEIYYIANQRDSGQRLEARFRVTGKEPELWYPMSGESKPASYSMSKDATTLELDLAERESLFVVFRKAAAVASRQVEPTKVQVLTTMTGPWRLSFQNGLGAPTGSISTELVSWTTNSDSGIKYFSGTGSYTKSLTVPAAWLARGRKVMLELGTVRDLAEVMVNGKSSGTVWAPPYTVDVTEELKPGVNEVEVKVTNEFTNRIMGDRLLPAEKKILPSAAAVRGMFAGPQEPPASGLLGPVRLESPAQ
jgi:hypothetical protein